MLRDDVADCVYMLADQERRSDQDPNQLCWPPRVSHLVALVSATVVIYSLVARQWPLVGTIALLVMLLAVDPSRLVALRALLPGGASVEAAMSPSGASPPEDER
jgi:hypothetical protein